MHPKFALIVATCAVVAVVTYTPVEAYNFRSYAANNTNKSHDLIAGSRLPGDRLSYQENIVRPSSLWQITTIQKTFNVTRGERITQVVARDQKTDGTGAFATIVKGGPGMANVTIKFKSQRNHGIHFLVQIYSRL